MPRPRTRGRIVLPIALALVAICLVARDLGHVAWYREWRLSRMSLAALQRERGGRLDDPRLLYYIGLRLDQQGRFAEADPYLRNAVGLDPNSPRLRGEWASALLGGGLVKAAFGELREYAGTHPNSADAHLLLGRFYVAQDSMLRATEELNQALALDPRSAEAWSLLAAAQGALNHLGPAEAAAARAVALAPRNAKYRIGLGLLQAKLGRQAAARPAFAQAVALAPGYAGAHREYARFLVETNAGPADRALAESEARRALALDPNDPVPPLVLGRALAAQGQEGAALPFLRQAAALSPTDPVPALFLARTYRRLGQDGPAWTWEQNYQGRRRRNDLKASLVTAIQKDPRDPAPQWRLARVFAEEGDVTDCVRQHAEALHCAPDAPPAQAAAADDLAAAGYGAQALPLARRAVAVAHNSPLAREAMGNVLVALGQLQEAAVFYGQAARLMPDRRELYQKHIEDYARRHGRTDVPTVPGA